MGRYYEEAAAVWRERGHGRNGVTVLISRLLLKLKLQAAPVNMAVANVAV